MKATRNSTNNNQNIEDALHCAILLLYALETNVCPFQTRTKKFPIKLIRDVARYNKLTISLTHIATCAHCQSLVSQQGYKDIQSIQKNAPAKHLLLIHERHVFERVAKRLHIPYVYVKDRHEAPQTFSIRHGIVGTDIDVLVDPSSIAKVTVWYKNNGYNVIDYKDKEINVINKKTHIALDIHKTIAYPHSGEMFQQDREAVSDVTAMCMRSKNPYLSLDMLLLTSIIRFFTNDIARGLKSILDILELSYIYEDKISWETLIPMLQRLGYYTRYLYILRLGKRLFHIPRMPWFLTSAYIPKRVACAVATTSLTDCVYMDDFCKWNTKAYQQRARVYYERYLFLTYLADIRYPLTALLHPRYISVGKTILSRMMHALFFLYTKNPYLPFPYNITRQEPQTKPSTIGKTTYLTILGTSMTPCLKKGMMVETIKQTTLAVGDIVVVRNTLFVGHRITHIDSTTPPLYEIKGDAVPYADNRYRQDDIIGVVHTIHHKGNTYALKSPPIQRLSRIIAYCSRQKLLQGKLIMNLLGNIYWMILKNQKIH